MSALSEWVTALEARHLADLRVAEATRALRALSSAYVERRQRPTMSAGGGRQRVIGALDTAGKRAAFALFYAPLHFIAVSEAVRTMAAGTPAPRTILDLGCGTGAGGAGWALSTSAAPTVIGIDRHPWAVAEARWTYRTLGVHGRAQQGDVSRVTIPRRSDVAVLAAYLLNELADPTRIALESRLLDAASHGSRVLVIEPIARRVAPWWDDTAARFIALGGRSDEWRIPADLPPLLRMFDTAAGLNHRELTFRTLFV